VLVDAKVLLYWPGEARPFGYSSAYVHFLDVTFIERESESGTSYFSSCCHVIIISNHFVYDNLSLSLIRQARNPPIKYELLAHLLWKRELEMHCLGLHWALSLSLSLSCVWGHIYVVDIQIYKVEVGLDRQLVWKTQLKPFDRFKVVIVFYFSYSCALNWKFFNSYSFLVFSPCIGISNNWTPACMLNIHFN